VIRRGSPPGGPGDTCGKCDGTGIKEGRWMGAGPGPCPMCGGKGLGGRAAGVPPDKYNDWMFGRRNPPPEPDGAKRRTDDNLRGVFG